MLSWRECPIDLVGAAIGVWGVLCGCWDVLFVTGSAVGLSLGVFKLDRSEPLVVGPSGGSRGEP